MRWDDLQRINDVERLADLGPVVAGFVRDLAFDYFVLAAHSAPAEGPAQAPAPALVLHQLPADWVRARYAMLAREDGQRRDPLVRHAAAGLPPTSWSCDGRVLTTDRQIRRAAVPLLAMAGDFGLRSGVTIPLYQPGVRWSFMNFVSRRRQDPATVARTLADTSLVAHLVESRLRRIAGQARPPVRLTPREAEVLQWTAIGKTSWEISVILRIAERTVNLHVANAVRKLGVRGRTAACARAVADGLICI